MAPIPSGDLMQGTVVLREVYDELDATDEPVPVICSINVDEGAKAEQVVSALKALGIQVDETQHTDYYVFAVLKDAKQARAIDKSQTQKRKGSRVIHHVWLDKKMSCCVESSAKTINAVAARELFSCDGEGVHWAILDTGLDTGHSLLASRCVPPQHNFADNVAGDEVGHGTHVAGIIAQIAPGAKLHDYKVLGPNGGSASGIIKAMHEIRRLNFEAGETVIHGINMSLGGPVPVGSYGCGWSPECQEANRLMTSGVVVCVAASNDGYKTLATVTSGELDLFPTFMDMGIADPGNAAEVITVGSTHKTRPHTYGPSFFSSKGPTGDGRAKPDCVAPGEKISSAKAGTKKDMTLMSGTSMATPHVSGAIAVFLSAKQEFLGRATEVKRVLLGSCTDLDRDRYFQGAGLVDVLRMIQSV